MTAPQTAPWRTQVEVPLVAALTTWVAMLSWRGFTQQPSGFLVPMLAVAVGVALLGATLRWRRLPGLGVVAVQVVAALVAANLLIVGSVLPGPALGDSIRQALDDASTYASPVPQTDVVSVHPLLILGGVAIALMIDVIACTLGRVPLAGIPVLAIYSVPVSLLDDGLPWWVFAGTALLFLLMLFLQEQQQVGRWGRALAGRDGVQPAGWRPHDHAVRASATAIGAIAVVAAVVLPAAVPTLSLQVFAIGPGSGKGTDIDINNPIVDLRRDLKQGADDDLVRVTTDDPNPEYLRISVLNRYTGDQWSSGDRSVPSDQRADGALPALQGVSPSIERTTYNYQVQVEPAFHSTWLPTQAPISSIDAAGDWRFDDATMDFLAGDDDLDTADLSYSMTAVDLGYTARELSAASLRPPEVSDELTALPDDLPDILTSEAIDVTDRASTPFDEAVALQNWFRDNFTYSLATPSGTSAGDLTTFLTKGPDGRTGYCEQFAASMAIMARYLGIPARVAIGFLRPDAVDRANGVYEYSAHDLHAWPELYFQGAGWVRFDPTPGGPGGRVQQAPSYTEGAVVKDPKVPSTTTTAEPTERATRGEPSATPVPRQQDATPPQTPTPTATASGGGFPVVPVVGGAGLLLLVALVLTAPRLVRARRRAVRLAGDAEEVWLELHATLADLRLHWPAGRSPRATRGHLVALFGRPGDVAHRPARGADRAPEAAAALDRIVGELERSRYSRTPDVAEPGALADDGLLCVDALTAGASPRARRAAVWLPWSLVTRRSPRASRSPVPTDPRPVTGVVERM